MQVPKRKSEMNRRNAKVTDFFLSAAAIKKLRDELRNLEATHPTAAENLRRAAEMGDRSENAAYSEAKGKLMRINTRMLEVKEELKNAIEIEEGPDADGRVRVGARVRVMIGEERREKSYTITGSAETDPGTGRISYLSPLGVALTGHKDGDVVMFRGANGIEIKYEIVEVY